MTSQPVNETIENKFYLGILEKKDYFVWRGIAVWW